MDALRLTVIGVIVIGFVFETVLSAIDVAEAPAKRAWGPEQVTGPPDTPGAGDIQTAWASATEDGQDEWLELEYAEVIEPAVIIVHETYNPGALYRVTAFTAGGMQGELWTGKDPTPVGADRGVSQIKVEPILKTNRIRIYLKSKDVPGWNEIDAVGIKDTAGKTHWAVKATASSTYGGVAEGAFILPFGEEPPRGFPIERIPRR